MKTPPVTDTRELEGLLRDSAGLQDAPEHVIWRAESLWAPARAAAVPPGPLRRLLAHLSFDSGGAAGLALGLRGDEAAGRQWLFTSEAHDFDLRCEAGDGPPGQPWRLSGQVLGPEGPGELLLFTGAAEPQPAQAPLRRVALGELSDFRCDGLPAGPCRLVFLLGELRVDLPPIELGLGAGPPAAT